MTLEDLKTADRVIGVKQVTKAVGRDLAKRVFLAADAESKVLEALRLLCEAKAVEIVETATMAELGKACEIEVGAAAAAVLK